MPAQEEVLEAARYLDTTFFRKEFLLAAVVTRAVDAGSRCSKATLEAAVLESPHVWRIDNNRYRLSISGRLP
jgi:hypothetical protein